MKNLFFAVLYLFFLSGLSLAQSMPQPTATPPKSNETEEVVKISTALIQIDVTVTDKNGKIVTDLKPEDFEIYENGAKQDISSQVIILKIQR
jgi:ABC-type antimicrobial peptide transport system permease subunit